MLSEYEFGLLRKKINDHFDSEMMITKILSCCSSEQKKILSEFMLHHPHAMSVQDISERTMNILKEKIRKNFEEKKNG